MNVLVVVDVQVDFTTGSLGSDDAASRVDAIVEYASKFDGEVVCTRDCHGDNYLETQEGSKLPVAHCITGTEGVCLAPSLEVAAKENGWQVFDKPTFGSVDLARYLVNLNDLEPIDSITLVGFCTDICVVSNALLLKAFMPEVPIKVVESLCAGVSKELHDAAIATMKSCQIEIL